MNYKTIIVPLLIVILQEHFSIGAIMFNSDVNIVDRYPAKPNEVLPIQPLLVYPKPRVYSYQGRNLERDNNIIYVKLLRHNSYRPRQHLHDQINDSGKELTVKDIFYVKALANGQFSPQRLKWYKLPEFYSISVYHKNNQEY